MEIRLQRQGYAKGRQSTPFVLLCLPDWLD